MWRSFWSGSTQPQDLGLGFCFRFIGKTPLLNRLWASLVNKVVWRGLLEVYNPLGQTKQLWASTLMTVASWQVLSKNQNSRLHFEVKSVFILKETHTYCFMVYGGGRWSPSASQEILTLCFVLWLGASPHMHAASATIVGRGLYHQ